MKISIISDLHFGFGKDGERKGDTFRNAKDCIEKAINSDLILIGGDLFHSRFPRPEIWAEGMKILNKAHNVQSKNFEVIKLENKDEKDISPHALKGVPIIAIHGTHERAGSSINPVQGLEKAGFLIHLSLSTIVLKLANEKVAIHGMSGVPERNAKEKLEEWYPTPIRDAFNIIVFHQNLKPYLPIEPSLSFEDLPKGFDLYVSGHIHWREKSEVNGKPFIIPGSTVTTQLRKKESKLKKGFWSLETKDNELEDLKFIELETPRKVFYKNLEFNGEPISEIEENVREELKRILKQDFKRKPLVRLRLTGELGKGFTKRDLDLNSIIGGWKEKAIITLGKDLTEKGRDEKVEVLRNLREEKFSVKEIGMKILKENLSEVKSQLEYEEVLELLVEDKIDKAYNTLMELIKDLDGSEKEEKEEDSEKEEVEEQVKAIESQKEKTKEEEINSGTRKGLKQWESFKS